jgi:hypothetical protein
MQPSPAVFKVQGPPSPVGVGVRQVLLVASHTRGEQQSDEVEQVLPAPTQGAVQAPPLQVRPVQHSEDTVQAAATAPQLEPLEPPLLELPASPLVLVEQADKRPPATVAAASIPRTFFELTFIGLDS